MVWTDSLEEFRKVGFPLLYIGPEGTGKWDRLASFARELGDPFLVREPAMEDARYVVSRYAQKPLFGSGRVVTVIGLDRASEGVQHALLKTLEDPGEWKAIMLCASADPLRTVVSRCKVVRVGALSDELVRERLLEGGHSAVMVSTLAELCGGSPSRADYLSRLWPRRSRVVSLVQALSRRDRTALVELSNTWDADDWLAARRFCLEAIADWSQCFSEPEFELVDMDMVYRLVVEADERATLEAVVLRLWDK